MLSEPSYPRHPGGAGKCTHVLATGLVRRGHDLHILCESKEDTELETIDGVQVHRVRLTVPDGCARAEKEKSFALQMLGYLERELPASEIDVVHDSGGFLSYFYRVAYQLRRDHRIPVVVHFRYLISRHRAAAHVPGRFSAFGADILGLEALIEELTQAFPVRFADAIICPSRQDAKFVNEAFKATGRPYVVPDPVDLRIFPQRGPETPPASFAPAGTELVLFGGRIDSDVKGGDTVVDAMRRLRSHRPNLRLVLLGKREQDFEPFQRELGDMVIPLTWVQESASVAEILCAVDLVVVPSRYESFGMMCAEALATGTPVIASPAGGMTEMISHGQNGYLLGPGGPRTWGEELAKYAEIVLSDASVARALGERARAYAEDCLALDRVALRVEDVYLATLDRQDRATGNGVHRPGAQRNRPCPLSGVVEPDAPCRGRRRRGGISRRLAELCRRAVPVMYPHERRESYPAAPFITRQTGLGISRRERDTVDQGGGRAESCRSPSFRRTISCGCFTAMTTRF